MNYNWIKGYPTEFGNYLVVLPPNNYTPKRIRFGYFGEFRANGASVVGFKPESFASVYPIDEIVAYIPIPEINNEWN